MNKIFNKIFNLFFSKNRENDPQDSSRFETSVVITGVEKSPKWGSCAGAGEDCNTFKEIIESAVEDCEITVLKNEQATADAWTTAVEKAVQKPLAIIFYSGHGGSDSTHALSDGSNEDDGIDEFLCLYDRPLVDDRIWDIISKSKGKVFMIFDCCHSGTMFRSANNEQFQEKAEPLKFSFGKFALSNRDAETNETKPSILCWSACADNTVAKGSIFGGMFTNSLKNLFKKEDTYQTLWNKLSSHQPLKRIETIQFNEVGKSFKDNLFCH